VALFALHDCHLPNPPQLCHIAINAGKKIESFIACQSIAKRSFELITNAKCFLAKIAIHSGGMSNILHTRSEANTMSLAAAAVLAAIPTLPFC